jgi:hypothetical protein
MNVHFNHIELARAASNFFIDNFVEFMLKHSNFMIESLFNSFIQVDHQIDQTSFDS